MSKSSLPIDFPLDPRKRAVLVGASSGLGAALARLLAKEGYILALLAPKSQQAKLEQVCAEINQSIGEQRALPYLHDVTKYKTVPTTFQTVLGDLKRIDTLVYIAGVMPLVDFSEYNFEKDLKMVEVNTLGAMAWLGQAAILFERMGAGQLVGISSVAGDRGRVSNPGYNVSKAGITTYLEALRNRLTRSGVHVMTVKPGMINTDMLIGVNKTVFVVSPEKAASDVWRGMRKKTQVVYTAGIWRFIMLVIRHVPSFIFRRLSF